MDTDGLLVSLQTDNLVADVKARPDLHAMLDCSEVKKAAGVEKAVTDKQLRFEHCAKVVASEQASEAMETERIHSNKHVWSRVAVTHRLTPAL